MENTHQTPLVTALTIAAAQPHAAFYTPGHKRGQGASAALQKLVGPTALRGDLPELPGLDNLFAPEGPIAQAQQLAAATFGAEATYFLANGSTSGIEAAMLAVSGPKSALLVPRNVHQSVLSGLVLSGAQPFYLAPIHHPDWDLALGITAAQVEQALTRHPEIRAVLLVSPNYQGVCADVAAIAQAAHRHGAVLIVDEAHGPHFGFHPRLPPSALMAGADVVVQSTHKVLGAMTQASMLHVQGPRVDRDRLTQALQMTQSSSPNYLLLASLDAARQQMAIAGTELMAETLVIAEQMRTQLAELLPLRLLTPQALQSIEVSFCLDCTRLTIDVSGLGLSGFAADTFLHEVQQVTAELPTLRQLAFIISLGNRREEGDRLVAAFHALIEHSTQLAPAAILECPRLMLPVVTQPVMTPREAFWTSSHVVPLDAAVGQLCQASLCPYPPGIPILLPGERITAEHLDYLLQVRRMGGVVTGIADPTWQTLRVLQPH
ncbi:MAG: aminotransferase class I/II-fold pyridoxal phosphate-dependent enzyme [Leptolyngbyaceae cyanobacterium]